jgi:hypothetical protein
MAAPYEVKTKLYMLDRAERNLVNGSDSKQRIQVDEMSRRGVRIIVHELSMADAEESCRNPVADPGAQ